MRNILISALLLIFLLPMTQAQNPSFKKGLFVKRGFTDYSTLQGGKFTKFRSYRPTWEFGYTQMIAKNLNLIVPLRAGVFSSSEEEARNTSFWSIDAQAQYYWMKPEWVVHPFVVGGISVVKEYGGSFTPQVPLGAGLFVKIHEQAFITWSSEYRLAFEEDRSNFQHGIGFTYLFGPKKTAEEKKIVEVEEKSLDSDGDGVIDAEDLCPNTAGLIEFTGCPDTDGDGVHDKLDKCPEISGLAAMNGCPDSDNDGISDNDDKCPNMAGTISNNGCPLSDDDKDGIPNNLDECPFDVGTPALNGCPDTDSDGVADKNDKCPNVAGLVSNAGCPAVGDSDKDGIADNQDECPTIAGLIQYNGCPDTDGDGLPDAKDGCPGTAGPISNGGCPVIAAKDIETLEIAMRAVQFDVGRSTLKQESFRVLNQVSEIMKRYPDYNLVISGHTDNTGSASVNQRISERRAQTCYEYLVSRGIRSSRMRYAGYGETRPVADNATRDGQFLNRRVEFELVPGGR